MPTTHLRAPALALAALTTVALAGPATASATNVSNGFGPFVAADCGPSGPDEDGSSAIRMCLRHAGTHIISGAQIARIGATATRPFYWTDDRRSPTGGGATRDLNYHSGRLTLPQGQTRTIWVQFTNASASLCYRSEVTIAPTPTTLREIASPWRNGANGFCRY